MSQTAVPAEGVFADESARQAHELIQTVRRNVARVVVGQDEVVDRILIALLTGGHLLLQGVPGLAKTLLVNAVAKAIDLQFGRVQFTIDLLPSDIIGSEILDQQTGTFHIHKGPIFTNLLLADEINRAAPKVQSALLEAMQERKSTIGNESFPLPVPFLVIATQNPVEQAGTFELPEAQLDRFMMCHRLNYPKTEEEVDIIRLNLGLGLNRNEQGAVPKTVFDLIEGGDAVNLDVLTSAMEAVQKVFVSDVFISHTVELVKNTRTSKWIELGCSPRAGIALVNASRARAFIQGRDHVVPEDLFALAEDIILHRTRLTYEALAVGKTGPGVLKELIDSLS